MKPPPFDMVMNLKEAKKREKATLDKHSKKYIFKNIRTCSEFARSQREKINKTLLRKNGKLSMTSQYKDQSSFGSSSIKNKDSSASSSPMKII